MQKSNQKRNVLVATRRVAQKKIKAQIRRKQNQNEGRREICIPLVGTCVIRTQEGQGREYTEKDREYVPPISTPRLPPQPRRRTRGTSKLRASSVPLNTSRRGKKRILPVINEEESATFEDDLGKELSDINAKNPQQGENAFNGTLPQGVLPR